MRSLLVVLAALFTFPAFAQDRLALVIGNDGYANVPKLEKAVADAEAVAAELSRQGYRTFAATDVGRREMNRTISEFTAALEPGDTAVVFYAGHGVEIDGENYLLPTDIVAPNAGESDFVKSESIPLSGLLDRVRATGARMAIFIVDACRDNPFAVATGRSIGRTRGLGRIVAPQGTFVIFSAGAGQQALDRLNATDEAGNSVFTRALLPRLAQPGLELRSLVSDLRLEVRDLALSVQHQQVPAYYDELLGEFYFTPAAASAQAPPSQADDPMRADLELAREIGTAEAFDSFLARYAARGDEYAYLVAQQLRAGLDDAAPEPEARDADPSPKPGVKALVPVTEPPAAPVRTRRDIVRDTQVALNAVGCGAGVADGVVGPRTRSAFAGFVTASGAGLSPDDLGTETALAAVRSRSGTICKRQPVAAAPPAGDPSAAPGPTLAGTWSFRADCALFTKVTGTATYRKAGANFYRGRIDDSLGQTASAEIYLNGQEISGKAYFPKQTNVFTGRIAPDGKSYTTSGTSTCKVYAQRIR